MVEPVETPVVEPPVVEPPVVELPVVELVETPAESGILRFRAAQPGQVTHPALNQRDAFRATPTLNLLLPGEGILDPVEVLAEHEFHWQARRGVTASLTGLVLSET